VDPNPRQKLIRIDLQEVYHTLLEIWIRWCYHVSYSQQINNGDTWLFSSGHKPVVIVARNKQCHTHLFLV